VQERRTLYQLVDELRVSASSLGDRVLFAFALFVAHGVFFLIEADEGGLEKLTGL
jgi:hypothetical protein